MTSLLDLPRVERRDHRFVAENGRIRLDFDLRSEFPYFNFIHLAPEVGAEYRRFCNFGVEGMPAASELLAEMGADAEEFASDADAGPPPTVWLMGHDYKAKVLRREEGGRLDLQISYPPPMVVAGELSALGGGGDQRGFPDWGEYYWEKVETMQSAIQAIWTLEAGQPWLDLQVVPALGTFAALMPMLLHGFCGHDDIPQRAFIGGRFCDCQSPRGDYFASSELIEQGRGALLDHSLAQNRLFLFFGEEPNSTAIAVGLHRPDPNGFLHLGQNEPSADSHNPDAPFAEAARRGDWQPDRVRGRGFLEQIFFLDAQPGQTPAKLRIGFYPNSPLPYGQATKVRAWIASKPELAPFVA
jgi:hypothetical protein